MMDGAVSREELVAHADGRLDAERAAAVAAWLRDNPDAAQMVETWRVQADLLRAVLDPVLQEPVPPPLLKAARQRRPRFLRRIAVPAAAAVAGIAIGLGGGWMLWARSAPALAWQMAEVGLSAHEVYAAEVRHPVEVWQDDEAHLVSWLSKRIDNPVKPPDLTSDGLKLLGGRVVPEDGRPAALLMYEGADGERYSLLISRAPRPATTGLRYAEGSAAGAFYWLDGKVGYVLSGPDNRERLRALTQAVYDQLP